MVDWNEDGGDIADATVTDGEHIFGSYRVPTTDDGFTEKEVTDIVLGPVPKKTRVLGVVNTTIQALVLVHYLVVIALLVLSNAWDSVFGSVTGWSLAALWVVVLMINERYTRSLNYGLRASFSLNRIRGDTVARQDEMLECLRSAVDYIVDHAAGLPDGDPNRRRIADAMKKHLRKYENARTKRPLWWERSEEAKKAKKANKKKESNEKGSV